MVTGQNKQPHKALKPGTLSTAAQFRGVHQILLRVSRNGGYSDRTKNELLHILWSATDEVLDILEEILEVRPKTQAWVRVWHDDCVMS
jgi:hypothetical protein